MSSKLSAAPTFRGIHDSIVNYGGNENPKVIFCCHEEISVAIAHGYGKAKGKPMAAITHNIVGLQHATMAIFNAWCDQVPVIVLGGTGPMDTTRRHPRIDWIHTALIQGTQVRDYVKWDDQPYSLPSVPMSFVRAHRIATTEPKGPVYICYDAEIQEKEIHGDIEIPDLNRFSPPAPMQANPEALGRAAQLLVEAQAPLIIADYLGRNQDSVAALIEFAELLAIPVIDKGGRFNFPNTHPLDVTGGAQEFVKNADVILALDVQDIQGTLTSLDRATRILKDLVSPSVKIINLSLNDLRIRSWAGDHNSLQPADVPLCGDSSVALPELTRLCGGLIGSDQKIRNAIDARFSVVREAHDRLRSKWMKEASGTNRRQDISRAFLSLELWEVIKSEDWVLANEDRGGWSRKIWDRTRPYQFLGGSGGAGLGYGMGASIGAALAHLGTGRLCVDIQPDGDFLMTPSALWTAAHHQVPLLIVMYNNQSFYNSETHAAEVARLRNRPVENAGIGTHLDGPPIDFAKMAESYGIHGEGPVTRTDELRPALQRALNVVKGKGRPALVDVVTDPR